MKWNSRMSPRLILLILLTTLATGSPLFTWASPSPEQLSKKVFFDVMVADTLNKKGAAATVKRLLDNLQNDAASGNKYMQFELGMIYSLHFKYVKYDIPASIKWLTKSADQGYAEAQNRLGELYGEDGADGFQDLIKSHKLYQQAADQGDVHAQKHLSQQYYNGIGTPKNYESAFKYASLAADKGNIGAQLQLALMYSSGSGVSEDPEQALKWVMIAHSDGSKELDRPLEKLKAAFPQFVDGAQKLAAQWLVEHPNQKPSN